MLKTNNLTKLFCFGIPEALFGKRVARQYAVTGDCHSVGLQTIAILRLTPFDTSFLKEAYGTGGLRKPEALFGKRVARQYAVTGDCHSVGLRNRRVEETESPLWKEGGAAKRRDG